MDEKVFVEMLDGCIRNEPKAQDALYNKYRRFVYRTIASHFDEDFNTEEALSITFQKIFSNIHKLREKKERIFCEWMKRIAINNSLILRRRNEKLQVNEKITEIHLNSLEAEYKEYGNSDEFNFLLKIIDELPETQRTVFNLRAVDGYSTKEVCDKLNMHITACKSNYSRAKLKLQEKIKSKQWQNLKR